MARYYDSRTTIFSPGGELYQVRYAMEATKSASTCFGIIASDGILLVAECRLLDKLLDHSGVNIKKILKINENMACTAAGIMADANVLTTELRMLDQRYQNAYGEIIPCEQLVSLLCDVKHSYTQFGGKRPFGVCLLYMGWDSHYGYQLYMSDPSGNYGGWKATCIGKNKDIAITMLEKELGDGKQISLDEAKDLALKVFSTTADTTQLKPQMIEMATLQRENNQTQITMLQNSDIDKLIEKHHKMMAEMEATKKNE